VSWRWLSEAALLAAHEQQIAEHGGEPGLRDAGLLASALARPRNKAAYGKPDAATLAAAYAFGVARNHPFVDGNKRVALLAAEAFLYDNGYALDVDDAAIYDAVMKLADGTIGEAAFAAFLRKRLVPSNAPR
jgi:death-on-curing protein